MSMKAFQVLAIFNPSKEEETSGYKSKFIVEPCFILAKDAAAASMIVARKIPDEYIEKLDQVEVAVRPF